MSMSTRLADAMFLFEWHYLLWRVYLAFIFHIVFFPPLAILILPTLELCSPQPVTESLLRKSPASSHGSRQRIVLDSE